MVHPVLIFIFSIIALAMSLFLYIYWYMEVSTGLEGVVKKFDLDRGQFLESQTWVVIMVLSILVGIILIGLFIIFVYHIKTLRLYRLQHNFINSFTHELKTPVTSMKLYLETFIKHELSREDQLKYIDYMITDVDRLSVDINSILNLAKIESRSYSGDFMTLDLVHIIQRFCKKNRHLFRNFSINISNPSNRSYLYRIDLQLFEMLLMNLLTNAVKYNKTETPEMDISFTPDNNKLHVCFKDNGIGINKTEINKIFKKFYQVGESDDMTAKGCGLGLYLVDNIVRIHNWKIKVKSNGDGMGSEFILILPLES